VRNAQDECTGASADTVCAFPSQVSEGSGSILEVSLMFIDGMKVKLSSTAAELLLPT
jgi:hypothetical protein